MEKMYSRNRIYIKPDEQEKLSIFVFSWVVLA